MTMGGVAHDVAVAVDIFLAVVWIVEARIAEARMSEKPGRS
jgi:hypothetical protein